jgi:hypothetical protein
MSLGPAVPVPLHPPLPQNSNRYLLPADYIIQKALFSADFTTSIP